MATFWAAYFGGTEKPYEKHLSTRQDGGVGKKAFIQWLLTPLVKGSTLGPEPCFQDSLARHPVGVNRHALGRGERCQLWAPRQDPVRLPLLEAVTERSYGDA